MQNQKRLSLSEAREKIFHYCSYQERSHLEVKEKLFGLGVGRDDSDAILADLITQGFLNEERFAKAFAGGKFRMKSWGRIKITHALESKGVTANCIKAGLKEIDAEQYLVTLRQIIDRKLTQLTGDNQFVLFDKVASYAIQKGYEPDLVWKIIKETKKM